MPRQLVLYGRACAVPEASMGGPRAHKPRETARRMRDARRGQRGWAGHAHAPNRAAGPPSRCRRWTTPTRALLPARCPGLPQRFTSRHQGVAFYVEPGWRRLPQPCAPLRPSLAIRIFAPLSTSAFKSTAPAPSTSARRCVEMTAAGAAPRSIIRNRSASPPYLPPPPSVSPVFRAGGPAGRTRSRRGGVSERGGSACAAQPCVRR